MSVRGSLRTMSIEDTLSWLSRRLIRGTLTLENSVVARTFVCDSGYITNTSSTNPHEELGQVLLGTGLVDMEALSEARLVQADTGVSLSRILIMVGKIDEERVRAVLEENALEAILDVFLWDDGTFAVERTEEILPPSDPAIALQLRVCIEEGKKRATRWREIRQRIPGDDAVFTIANPQELAELAGAGQEGAMALIQAIEQGLSIERMIRELRLARFPLLDWLCMLLERDAIVVRDDSAPEADAETLLAESRRLASEGDRLGAFDLVSRALALEPANQQAQELHRTAERALFAELSRELLASFRVPKLLVARAELDRIELSDTERYLAGRVDGRWDLLSLMRASPVREAEALITFKRLADRGIITL
ncbi:MAG TPA: DUF4388 domain-containing protein [Haliangium sp.]|nr:DUF4388 domain-containing protein [Haliangium sp.]